MKDETFNGKDSISTIALLQDFNATCDAYYIHAGAEMCLFKQHRNNPVESVVKARVALSTETARAQEGCLMSYLAIVYYLLNRNATENNIAIVDDYIHTFKHKRLTANS